jgi:phosphatidylinositol glycan class C protein
MNSSNSNTSNSNRRLWLSPEDLSNLTSCNNNNNYNRRSNKNKRTTEDDEKEKKGATTRKRSVDTYETIFNHFSLKPKPKSLILLLSNTMVFVQEFVLTCLLLAGHRAALLEELDYRRRLEQPGSSGSGRSNPSVSIHSSRLLTSLGLIWLTLIVAVVKNRFANSKRYTIRHRFTDFLLMAILLRFLSAVLKTLTASYSSDTVYVLSTVSLFLHLVTCNYDYANGYDDDDNNNVDNVDDDENNDDDAIIASNRKKNQERPTFKGGMISLTSAFFATTLLASRLESNAAVYIFICSSVVLFALYPAARHLVAVKSRHVGKWSKS